MPLSMFDKSNPIIAFLFSFNHRFNWKNYEKKQQIIIILKLLNYTEKNQQKMKRPQLRVVALKLNIKKLIKIPIKYYNMIFERWGSDYFGLYKCLGYHDTLEVRLSGRQRTWCLYRVRYVDLFVNR